MKPWLLKLFVAALLLGAPGGFMALSRGDAPLPTDADLTFNRRQVDRMGAEAAERTDFQSARRALCVLLSNGELHDEVPQNGMPRPSVREREAAWAQMERRAETPLDWRNVESLRERYQAGVADAPVR
jgi:hypothetical protein